MVNVTPSRALDDTTLPTTIEDSFSFTLKFVSTSVLIVIIILTLLGNSLVIGAFVAFRKLRNVTNYFVASLAVTDILVAVFSMPLWAAYLLTGPQWVFSVWLLKIWQSMDIFCGVASISHLLLISIERYICISSPLTYHSIVTKRKTCFAICAAWLFAFIMTTIKTILWGKPTRVYQLVAFSLCFAAPVLVMSYAYLMIFRVSHTQAKKMVFKIGEKTKRFCLPRELKAAKTLGVVMGGFVVCWLPFFFLNIFHALCRSCTIDVVAVMIAKGLHYFNSVLNPIIYSVMNQQFKTAFKHLFHSPFYSLSSKDLHVRKAEVDRKLVTFSTRLSSLRSRSSVQEKPDCTANKLVTSPTRKATPVLTEV